jgi:integrase
VVDEIIFRTVNPRDRLILELMARGAMRVGKILKLKFEHIEDRKLVLFDPKSGIEAEVVSIPQKVADRLGELWPGVPNFCFENRMRSKKQVL